MLHNDKPPGSFPVEGAVESLLHDGWLARLRVLTRASLSVLLILAMCLSGGVLTASVRIDIFAGVGLTLLCRVLLFRHILTFSR